MRMDNVRLLCGSEAKVSFEHLQETVNDYDHPDGCVTHRATVCTISKVMPNGELKVLDVGVAMCHEGDTFCKETGRKRSLTNALQYKYYIKNENYHKLAYTEVSDSRFSKEEREVIWKAYFDRIPKK